MHYCMQCLWMLSMLTELYVYGFFVDHHAMQLHLCDQTQLVLYYWTHLTVSVTAAAVPSTVWKQAVAKRNMRSKGLATSQCSRYMRVEVYRAQMYTMAAGQSKNFKCTETDFCLPCHTTACVRLQGLSAQQISTTSQAEAAAGPTKAAPQ